MKEIAGAIAEGARAFLTAEYKICLLYTSQLNPTLEESSDLKTAVSEAVTNCIIHGYEGEIHKIRVECRLRGQELQVDVTDHGAGIPDIKKAMEPLLDVYKRQDPRSGT